MPAQQKSSKKKYGGRSWAREYLTDLEVPSGDLCQVRRPGITGLISAGLLDSMDSLSSLVQTEHIDRVEKGGKTTLSRDEVQALMKDPKKLADGMGLMDKVVEYVVVQPKVLRSVQRDEAGKPLLDDNGNEMLLADNERKSDVVYTDMIDMIDKIYIFQFVVGGVSDLEQFRQEFGESMDGMEALAGLPGQAE